MSSHAPDSTAPTKSGNRAPAEPEPFPLSSPPQTQKENPCPSPPQAHERDIPAAECGVTKLGADDGIRTRDPQLGKVLRNVQMDGSGPPTWSSVHEIVHCIHLVIPTTITHVQ